jgi:hypothetical protein
MSRPRRKIALLVAAATVLVAAGAAGAFVSSKIITIRRGDFADLVGTNVTCSSGRDIQTGITAFTCYRYNPKTGYPSQGTYAIEITTRGVVVQRWDSRFKHGSQVVRAYCSHRVARSRFAC